MAEGRVAFIGETAKASAFFASCGYPCPPFYNPADHYIETLAIQPYEKDTGHKRVSHICDTFRRIKPEKTTSYQHLSYHHIAEEEIKHSSPYSVGWITQFRALIWRSFLSVIREPKLIKVRLFQTIFISTLIGILYHGQSLNQDGIVNINGVLFYIVTNTTYSNIFAVINVFCTELPLFLREHHNGMYRTDAYFLAKNLAELPLFLLIPLLTFGISYFIIDLNPIFTKFLIAIGILELMTQTVISYGYFMSCSSSSLPLALGISSPVILPLYLFGGMFLRNGSIPQWLDWIKYFSWFFYSYEALVINQWSGVTNITCSNAFSTNETLSGNNAEEGCLRTGEEVLASLNFKEEDFMFSILMMVMLSILLRVFAYLSLLRRTSRG